MKEEDILTLARQRFKTCVDLESDNRSEAVADLRFYEGDQWPDSVQTAREEDNQPCLVLNKIPLYVRQITNEIRQMKPGVKIRGVDSVSDPGTAEIMGGMIRAIEQDSDAGSAYQWAADYAAKMGWGYWRILTEYETDGGFDQVIRVKRIRNPFSVYMGPGEQQDGSDCRFAFIAKRLPKDVFEDKYPNAKSEWSEQGFGDAGQAWVNEDGVRVAEYWEKITEKVTLSLVTNSTTGEQKEIEGEIPKDLPENITITDTRVVERCKVIQRIITGAEVLEENDWPGKYIPIVRVVGREVDIEGKVYRKGMVRDSKDAQRQYNYMRSASVERIALAPKAPFTGPRGAFQNPNWKTANKKNHAFLEWDTDAVMEAGGQAPRREPPPDVSPGLVTEIQTASQELKDIFGIYNAGLGDKGNEVSGVAIDSRRSESDVSNFDFADNYGKALVYNGKILVDLIPKIYTGDRMVRILKPDNSEETVRVNTPYIDQKTMQPRNYQLSAGRYDVVVDVGPSYATQRKEASEKMMQMIQAYPDVAPLIGDLVAKSFDWSGADEISKRLRMMVPAEIWMDENPQFKAAMQQKDQMLQMAQQQMAQMQDALQKLSLELQNRDKEIAVKQADLAEKSRANTLDHIEGMTKLELDARRNLNQAGAAYK